MLAGYVTSGVRTLSAYLVGLGLTWLAVHFNVVLDKGTAANLAALAAFALGSAYYLLARLLETKFPKLGVLLGVPKKPAYGAPAAADPLVGTATVATNMPTVTLALPPLPADAVTALPPLPATGKPVVENPDPMVGGSVPDQPTLTLIPPSNGA